MEPPLKCSQCGATDFMELKPEKDLSNFFCVLLAFIVDLFTPGATRMQSVEVYNKSRPGYMCKTCGWETRIKEESDGGPDQSKTCNKTTG